MLVQIHTNGHSHDREGLVEQIEAEVTETLSNFADQITRLEIHLGDENSHKGGDNDKRCMIEARVEGMAPNAVTHHAGTIDEAVTGAADKMKHALDSTLSRLRDARQPSASSMDPAVNLVGPVDDDDTQSEEIPAAEQGTARP